MRTDSIIQGRRLSAPDLAEIRTLRAEHPFWHRTRLSRELCERWGWRNEAGQLKDMACRSLLLKLQDRGLIELPARQRASVNGARNRRPVAVAHLLGPVTLLGDDLERPTPPSESRPSSSVHPGRRAWI